MGGSNKVMGPVEWLLLGTLGFVLWGGSFVFGKVVLAELRPLPLVLGRVGLAAVALNALVGASRHRLPRTLAAWCALFVMGVLGNPIPFSLIFWGQTRIGSGLAAILNASTPRFTVLLAHHLTPDERMTGHRLGGGLLGLAGVTVMVGPAALAHLGVDVLAQLAVLGAAVSYALAGMFGRRFAGDPPLVTAAGQVTATTAMAFLIPVTGILLGTTVLGERLDPRHFAGMAPIGLGLAAIDGRPVAFAARAWRTASIGQ